MGSQTGSPGQGTLGEQNKYVSALDPIASTGAVHNGVVLDRELFNTLVFLVQGGAVTGTPTTVTVDAKIQESDVSDGTGMTDAAVGAFGGVAITQQTAGAFAVKLETDYRKLKQFTRIVVTTAFTGGSSPTIPVSVSATVGAGERHPAV